MHGELAAGHVSREGTPKKKTKRRNRVYAETEKDWRNDERDSYTPQKWIPLTRSSLSLPSHNCAVVGSVESVLSTIRISNATNYDRSGCYRLQATSLALFACEVKKTGVDVDQVIRRLGRG